MAYRFTCSRCRFEYIHDSEHHRNCPECSQPNQTNGKFTPHQD